MSGRDAVIIGGGIIGCALARALAQEGLHVTVVEKGVPGEEASWAAAGMLAPSAEAERGSLLFELSRASLKLYAPWAAELCSETGIDLQYRTEGALLVFESEEERQAMLPSIEWQRNQGIAIEELSAEGLGEREPLLQGALGGFHLPEDHQIDNRLLMRALLESGRQRGVEFVSGKAVYEISRQGRAANGVLLEGGRIAADCVINAAGAWAGMICVSGLARAPIRPVKGQIVSLENPLSPLRHVIRSHRVYMVPGRDGRVLVGSTMEEVGFDKTPRAGALSRLMRAAQKLCPALEQSVVREFWAGLRPAAPDNLPILGPTALEGYFVALGHFRNGILLAPITAQILKDWVVRGKPSYPVEPLLPDRFASKQADA